MSYQQPHDLSGYALSDPEFFVPCAGDCEKRVWKAAAITQHYPTATLYFCSDACAAKWRAEHPTATAYGDGVSDSDTDYTIDTLSERAVDAYDEMSRPGLEGF